MSEVPAHHYPLNVRVNQVASNNPQFTDAARARVMAHQSELIRREFNELLAGFDQSDLREIRDGLADVIVTVDGLYHRLGLQAPTVTLNVPAPDGSDVAGYVGAIDALLTVIEGVAARAVEQAAQEPTQAIALDLGAVRLALDGILASVYAISDILGISVMDDQMAVYTSNMSKFDTDKDTARRTVQKYADLGVVAAIYPATIDDTTYYVVKCSAPTPEADAQRISVGKFLKSVNFAEPVFAPLPQLDALLSELSIEKAAFN